MRRLKNWAASLKRDVIALWFACRDPRTPWYAKWLATLIVAYALSPIDLIPDFIPIIGYLDDLILIPIGIYFVLRIIPEGVMADARGQAQDWIAARNRRPRNWIAAAVIFILWALLLWGACVWLIWPALFQD
jgi:uncharacterized membrane protein YkvA (DUF1232 family)